MHGRRSSRRAFLRLLPALGAALATTAMRPRPLAARLPHPDPRPGVDASRVTPRTKLAKTPDLADLFDKVREMPQIADGLACRCGCMEDPSVRSLLSCFEGDGMATHCVICQGQAETAHRLFKKGKSLAEIRAALDADFG